VFRGSWLGDYNDAYGFLQVLKAGFGINLPHYVNADYDELLERAANEADAGRRAALLRSAESLMLIDQPLIPLYFYVSKHLVNEHVHGWRNNVMNIVYSKDLSKTGDTADK
jgi:oligopeptide transport system substrate-binding protein